jgi:predicted MFS family arabinose efflux permease
MTFAGFTGYALLLPVAPLWAVHGGADTAGAGLVNAVMLVFTVLTQLLVPAALRRWGWAQVLVVGMVLLGVPAAAYAVTDALAPVLALSAVRGIGFGVLTVIGSAAIAALVEEGRRGEAIGAYGLAVALPNVVLLPAGPWLAEHLGYWFVFTVAAVPLLGIPASLRVAAVLHVRAPDLLHRPSQTHPSSAVEVPESTGAAYRALLRPMLLLLSVTLAGGAVVTFAPQMVASGTVVGAGLFLMGLVAALSRWRAGALADRHGAQPFLWPLLVLTALGTALVAWSVPGLGDTRTGLFLVAMVLLGVAYGALQNLTLVVAFSAVHRRHHNLASAVWNIGFDLGTAVGSVAVGVIALRASFSTALFCAALVAVLVLPMAWADPRRRSHP